MDRKNKKQIINLICAECGTHFNKELKEYTRRIEISGKNTFYCSIKCRNKIKKIDSLSPFRSYVRITRRTSKLKHILFDLDAKYLQELWEKQNGICPYTYLPMKLARTGSEKEFVPDVASVDRIDSSVGYVKGNVEFVCLSINYAKNKFSQKDFVEFLNKFRREVSMVSERL